jgi:hypothetical protein
MAEAPAVLADPPAESWASTVWDRRLSRYPTDAARHLYLALVVLIAVVLYYVYWEEGATP